jgi:Protoglobin
MNMDQSQAIEKPAMVANDIPGYNYGSSTVAKSPITVNELEELKASTGFTPEDGRWLRAGGDVLKGRAKGLVEKWRAVISAHPHLARYALWLDGEKDPHYSEASGLRFQQWVLHTCFRPRDHDWLNYQQEIALRHTSLKKNKTDDPPSRHRRIHRRH